jgi:MinD superfamily P-loop ATPase
MELGESAGIEFVQGKLNIGEVAAARVINDVKRYQSKGKLVIIDSSPGTSCPVVAAVKNTDFCLLVTEPTSFGLHDLTLAVEMLKNLEIPCGVVINRDGVGDTKVEEYCLSESIPILLRIPLDIEIAKLYSKGITLAQGMPEWQKKFTELFGDITLIVNGVNEKVETH